MGALSVDRDTLYKEGKDEELPVAASAKILGGSLVCSNATGYCAPAADTAAFIFQGVAQAQADNSATATDGYINVKIRRKGTFLFAAAGLTQADIGKEAFVTDDQTINITGGNHAVKVGVIQKIDSAVLAWVDINLR